MRRFLPWLIILITLTAIFLNVPKLPGNPQIPGTGINLNDTLSRFPIRLGLDLQGGIQLVLLADTSGLPAGEEDNALASARDIIEKRVNLFGVSEAVVQTSKLSNQRRILVDLPGVTDASAAADLVGKTAKLEIREIPASRSAEATESAIAPLLISEPTGITGADLKKFSVTFDQAQGQAGSAPSVSLEFTPEGAQKFAEVTKRNVGQVLPIFVDERLILAPVVNQEIVGGNAVITGNFTSEEAKNYVIQLNAGALPLPITILEQRLIGASLGQESVNKSLLAGIIGLSLVILYMAFYYGWLGVIADLALVIYALITLAIFRTGLFIIPPVTLTLAGIAGFILSIGMAVDANILIFERMKEERRRGNSFKTSVDLGFSRAWSSIRDSNISSLLTAGILMFMGTGLIKGFAITLAIGVLVSMFTALTVTRMLLKIFIARHK